MLVVAAIFEISARVLQFGILAKSFTPAHIANGLIRQPDRSPFVSVHIPTYNEPPNLVIATLESLACSEFKAFEVIVVDNNTHDAATWSPVADAAARLGGRFHFVHIDHLQGAKAGALNVALSMCAPHTTHVATVDADYQVDPKFIGDAVDQLVVNHVDYVQFPQAYRGVGRAARGVEHELGDYFARFSRAEGSPNSMLPTGTLSLFSIAALKAVGGWPMETITEDAELGVRLQAAGYRGLWVTLTRGRGLLPVDFRGLSKQRARWAAGNLQVLKRLHRFKWSVVSPGDFLILVVQLTSWISLLLPAAISLVLVGLVPQFPLSGLITGLSATTILASASLSGLRLVAFTGPQVRWPVKLEAFAAKTALTWTSALAWIPALIPHPIPFHRTSKAIEWSGRRRLTRLGVVSVAFFGVAVAYVVRNQFLEAAACFLLSSIWICAKSVDANLRRAASLNPELS